MTTPETLPLGKNAPAGEQLRSLPLALLYASGAILLICSEIWMIAGLSIWSLAGLFGGSVTVDAILAAIILPPAAWATWKTISLAVEAERQPDRDAQV